MHLTDRQPQQCSVTVFNKLLLHAPFPYLLTASHTNATFIACKLVRRNEPRTRIPRQIHLKLLCVSFLYTINIGISNASLGLVTLPVHQAIRATSPVITVLLAKVLVTHMSKRYGLKTYSSLLPIVAGVLLTTYGGRYNATPYGLLLTIFGAVLAVAKTIAMNILLRNAQFNLHPIELLSILSSYAGAQAILWAIWNGEPGVILEIAPRNMWFAILLSINTAMAAVLNIVSLDANRRSGPLAMAITANLKQVVLLIGSLEGELRGGQVVLGTFLTVVGSAWYAYSRFQDQQDQHSTATRMLPKCRGDGT